MKTYETFARHLDRLLGAEQALLITVPGYMPLSIEAIGRSADGGTLIALSHTAIQNGDLMRDPEIVFEIRTAAGVRTVNQGGCGGASLDTDGRTRRQSSRVGNRVG